MEVVRLVDRVRGLKLGVGLRTDRRRPIRRIYAKVVSSQKYNIPS